MNINLGIKMDRKRDPVYDQNQIVVNTQAQSRNNRLMWVGPN